MLIERIREKLAGYITPRGFDELIGEELAEVAQLEAALKYCQDDKVVMQNVIDVLEAETESLGILLSNLVDVEVERDKLEADRKRDAQIVSDWMNAHKRMQAEVARLREVSKKKQKEIDVLRHFHSLDERRVEKLYEIEHAAKQILRQDIGTEGGMSAFDNLKEKLDALKDNLRRR